VAEAVHASVYLCGSTDCPTEAVTDADIDAISTLLHNTKGVTDITFVDRREAYRRFREVFAARPDLLDSVSPDDLPESFRFTVRAPADYSTLARQLESLPGVDQVQRQPDPLITATPHL